MQQKYVCCRIWRQPPLLLSHELWDLPHQNTKQVIACAICTCTRSTYVWSVRADCCSLVPQALSTLHSRLFSGLISSHLQIASASCSWVRSLPYLVCVQLVCSRYAVKPYRLSFADRSAAVIAHSYSCLSARWYIVLWHRPDGTEEIMRAIFAWLKVRCQKRNWDR